MFHRDPLWVGQSEREERRVEESEAHARSLKAVLHAPFSPADLQRRDALLCPISSPISLRGRSPGSSTAAVRAGWIRLRRA